MDTIDITETAQVIETGNESHAETEIDYSQTQDSGLTPGQRLVKHECLEWLENDPEFDKYRVLTGFAGTGKLQPLTEPVLTPKGWVAMGEIKPGDLVISRKGQPIKVVETFPGENLKIYKVSFCDGTFTYCCDDHLWRVQTTKQRQRGTHWVKPLKELLPDISERKTSKHGFRYSIPLCEPINYRKKNFSIDPYLLGALLGDGCLSTSGTNQITLNKGVADSMWLLSYLQDKAPKGVKITPYSAQGTTKRIGVSHEIKKLLENLGLLGLYSQEKFIPKQYFLGSIEQRKQLLAGLLDTDGGVKSFPSGKVKTAFYSCSLQLAKDVMELIRSLGGYARMSVIDRSHEGKSTEYTVSVRVWFNPFRLPRKADAYGEYLPKAKPIKKMVSAEFIGFMDGQCLLLDDSQDDEHLYITRDYVVTHNTFVLKDIVSTFLAKNPYLSERDKAMIKAFHAKVETGAITHRQAQLTKLFGSIAICAPTHNAVEVARRATDGAYSYATVYSLFSLVMEKVVFTAGDEKALARLQALENITREQERAIAALLAKQEAAEKEERQITPKLDRLDLSGIRLIIVDESSMIPEVVLDQIFIAAYATGTPKDLQILFIGDPFQLPPVNEVKSQVFQLPQLTPLTDVVRNSGYILQYANSLRDRPHNLQGAHYPFVNKKAEFFETDAASLLRQIPKMLKRGDDVIFIAATNEAVDRYNRIIHELERGKQDKDYRVGDKIITRSRVERRTCLGDDGKPNCTNFRPPGYCSKCDRSSEIGTSQFLVIHEVIAHEVYTTFSGKNFRRTKVKVRPAHAGLDAIYKQTLNLCHPEDWKGWRQECERLGKRFSAFYSRSPRNKRGQKGETAKEIWAEEGLKNWDKWLDGSPLSDSDYKALRTKYLVHKKECQEAFDNVSLSYCITVHHCLPGDSLVTTFDGLIPLKDIKPGDLVLSHTGNFNPVINQVETGQKKVVKITTRSGLVFECSEDHRIYASCDGDIPSFEHAKNLKVGDYLTRSRHVFEGTETKLEKVENHSHTWVSPELPKTVDTCLSWLIGFLIGNGCLTDSASDGRIDFLGCQEHSDCIDLCCQIFKSYGLTPKVAVDGERLSGWVYSTLFYQYLNQLGVSCCLGKDKTIPDYIWTTTTENRQAFVSGLIDSDGCVRDTDIIYVTVSKKLAKGLQTLLMTLDVRSTISKQLNESCTQGYSWAVLVCGQAKDTLKPQLNLSSQIKKQKLKGLPEANRTLSDYLPCKKALLECFGELTGKDAALRSRIKTKINFSYAHLDQLILGAGMDSDLYLPAHFQNLHYLFDPIVSIDFTDDVVQMYDLEVEEDHSFIADTVVVHNSQGITVENVVVDLESIFRALKYSSSNRESEWDVYRILYTAATRAAKQLVFATS